MQFLNIHNRVATKLPAHNSSVRECAPPGCYQYSANSPVRGLHNTLFFIALRAVALAIFLL